MSFIYLKTNNYWKSWINLFSSCQKLGINPKMPRKFWKIPKMPRTFVSYQKGPVVSDKWTNSHISVISREISSVVSTHRDNMKLHRRINSVNRLKDFCQQVANHSSVGLQTFSIHVACCSVIRNRHHDAWVRNEGIKDGHIGITTGVTTWCLMVSTVIWPDLTGYDRWHTPARGVSRRVWEAMTTVLRGSTRG